MYCLSTIVALNAKASAKPSRNTSHTNREPSRCHSRGGLVVHSANLRSTVFIDGDTIEGAREIERIEGAFERYGKDNNLKRLNGIVDSLF